MFLLKRYSFLLIASVALLASIPSTMLGQATGQRIYSSGHSFHYFMPPILGDIAKKAGVKDHTQVGLSAIGGSRVWQHWTTQTVVAKESNDVKLPAETIQVASTDRFAPKGEFTVETSDGSVTVSYTGKTNKTFTGCKGGNGTLIAGKKVNQDDNAVKQALKSGKIDVFTMSPIYLPDDGIENFVKLGLDSNPKIRIFVQENWLPWDHYDVAFKAPKEKVDHNAPTVDSLRKMHGPYFKAIDEHVADLNKKHNTKAVRVAPVGQAVILLRDKIIGGQAPGLKEQNDLFSDPIGHAKAPQQALVAYVYFALIYERNPVGLPVPGILAKAPEAEKLNRLLQEIAWQAVTQHPLAGVTKDSKQK